MQALFTVIKVEGRKAECCAVEQGARIKKALYLGDPGQHGGRLPWLGRKGAELAAASPIF